MSPPPPHDRLDAREHALLLLCARTSVPPRGRASVRALVQDGVDWPTVIETASDHGVLPLVSRNLRAICPERLPPRRAASLARFSRLHALRNQFLARELVSAVQQLEQRGVVAVSFKGPVLAQAAYRDLSLREFSDLDLLVQPGQLEAACDALVAMGYRRVGAASQSEPRPIAAGRYHVFRRGRGSAEVRLDLQSVIRGDQFAFLLDGKELWGHTVEIPLEGTRVRGLRAEDLLLLLCVHGSKHLWERLKWVCDVAELVRTHEPTLDWGAIRAHAADMGARRMLELGLALAQDLVGTEATEDALAHMGEADRDVRVMARQVAGQMFRMTTTPPGSFPRSAFYLRLRDRRADRLRYYLLLALRTWGEDRWDSLPHPFWFGAFYYLALPLRLLVTFALRTRHRQALTEWLRAM